MTGKIYVGWTGEELKKGEQLKNQEGEGYLMITKEGEIIGRNEKSKRKKEKEDKKNEEEKDKNSMKEHLEEKNAWKMVEETIRKEKKEMKKKILDQIWNKETPEGNGTIWGNMTQSKEERNRSLAVMVNKINNDIFDYLQSEEETHATPIYIIGEETYEAETRYETIESVQVKQIKIENVRWEAKSALGEAETKEEWNREGLKYIRQIIECVFEMNQARKNVSILEDILFAINCMRSNKRNDIKKSNLKVKLEECEKKKKYLEEFNYTQMKYQINSVRVPKTQNTLISYLNEQQQKKGYGIYMQSKGELQSQLREMIDQANQILAYAEEEYDGEHYYNNNNKVDTKTIIKKTITTLGQLVEDKIQKEQLTSELKTILEELQQGAERQNENHCAFIEPFVIAYEQMTTMNETCAPLETLLNTNLNDKFKIIKYAHNLRTAYDKSLEEVKRRHNFHDELNRATAGIVDDVAVKIDQENGKRRDFVKTLKELLGNDAMVGIVPGILEEVEGQSLQLSIDLNLPSREELANVDTDGDEIHLDMTQSISQALPLKLPTIEQPKHVKYEETIEKLNQKVLNQDEELRMMKTTLKKERNNTRNTMVQFQDENNRFKNRWQEKKHEVQEQNKRIAMLERQVQELKTKSATLENEKMLLSQDLEESKGLMKRKDLLLNEKSSTIASLNNYVTDLQKDFDEMKNKTCSLTNALQKVQSDMANKEKSISSLQGNLNMLQAKTENDQQEAIKKYSTQLEYANKQLQEASEHASSLQQQFNNEKGRLQEEITKLKLRNTHHEKESQSTIKAMQDRIDDLEDTKRKLGEKNGQVSRKLGELVTKLSDAEKLEIHLKDQLTNNQELFQTQKAGMEDQLKIIQELKAHKLAATNEVNHLRTEMGYKQNELDNMKSQNKKQLKILNDKCNVCFKKVRPDVHDKISEINQLHKQYEKVNGDKIKNIADRLNLIVMVVENFCSTLKPLEILHQVGYFLENVKTYLTYLMKLSESLRRLSKKSATKNTSKASTTTISNPSTPIAEMKHAIQLNDIITVKHVDGQWVIQEGNGEYVLANESRSAAESRVKEDTFKGQVIMFEESDDDGPTRVIVDLIKK